jgi:hypothetical protein
VEVGLNRRIETERGHGNDQNRLRRRRSWSVCFGGGCATVLVDCSPSGVERVWRDSHEKKIYLNNGPSWDESVSEDMAHHHFYRSMCILDSALMLRTANLGYVMYRSDVFGDTMGEGARSSLGADFPRLECVPVDEQAQAVNLTTCPGGMILEMRRAQVAERREESPRIQAVVDEAGRIGHQILDDLVVHLVSASLLSIFMKLSAPESSYGLSRRPRPTHENGKWRMITVPNRPVCSATRQVVPALYSAQ